MNERASDYLFWLAAVAAVVIVAAALCGFMGSPK